MGNFWIGDNCKTFSCNGFYLWDWMSLCGTSGLHVYVQLVCRGIYSHRYGVLSHYCRGDSLLIYCELNVISFTAWMIDKSGVGSVLILLYCCSCLVWCPLMLWWCSWCFSLLCIELVLTPEVISEASICQCIVKDYCAVKCQLKPWWVQCTLLNPEDHHKTEVECPSV